MSHIIEQAFRAICAERASAFVIAGALCTGWGTATAQSLEWARAFGGSANDKGFCVATDDAGNVYTSGVFIGVVDMDPGAGVSTLTATGNADHFVQKLDASGNFIWAVHFAGASASAGEGTPVSVDPWGNVLVAGTFTNTVDLDPGPDTSEFSSVGGADVFVVKLDPSGGLIWARSWGGASGNGDNVYAIACDSAGNVITTGTFWGIADLDPGPGVVNLGVAGQASDVFVQKMDASGNLLWARGFGGISGDQPGSVRIDGAGNILAVGRFQETVDFDPGAGIHELVSAGLYDAFIQKLDADGEFVWARRIGGDSFDFGNAVALDDQDNVLVTGSFFGFVDLDPGTGSDTLYSGGDVAGFVLKLAADGSYQWGRSLGKVDPDAILVDADGRVVTSGDFSQSVDFDPGPGTGYLDSEGAGDIFLQRMDGSGIFISAQRFGGSLDESAGQSMALAPSGALLMTGSFRGTVDLDPGPGTNTIVSSGFQDVLVMKLAGSSSGMADLENVDALQVFPNPANDRVRIEVDETLIGERATIALFDATGRRVLAEENRVLAMLTEIALPAQLHEGVYILMLHAEGANPSTSRVVVKRW